MGRGEFELKVFQVSKSFGSSSNKFIQIQELLGLIQKLGLISCTHHGVHLNIKILCYLHQNKILFEKHYVKEHFFFHAYYPIF